MASPGSSAGQLFRSLAFFVVLFAAYTSASPAPQEGAGPADSATSAGTTAPTATAGPAASPSASEGLRNGGNAAANVETYDYIVVGSGPGGAVVACNLAKANHTVLLLEAGDDQSGDISTQILSLSGLKQTTRWDFYVKHYADQQQTLRHNYLTWRRADGSLWVGPGATAPSDATLLGVYYPRGATLGGSSVVNIAATWLPNDREWNDIAALTGDTSWG
jgi:hypothetical protein